LIFFVDFLHKYIYYMWVKMGQNGLNRRFRGSFVLKVDDRGRIKIPSQYLSILKEQYGIELYITSLNGDRVYLYPLKVWEGIEQSIERIKIRSPEIDEYISRTSYWGNEGEVDARGRVLIPPELRQKSQLNGANLRIFGKIDHLVLWNERLFKEISLSGEFSDEKLQKVSRLITEQPALTDDE
jgi:MraZ protein